MDDTFQLSDEDGWFQLLKFGSFPTRDEDGETVIQVFEPGDDLDALIKYINQQWTDGGGIMVDYDHQSESYDGSTRAAGWVRGAEARADGLWVNIRWTSSGKTSVSGGDYRFLSPSFAESDVIRPQTGPARMRPTVLCSVALCNQPNIRGCTPLTVVANRRASAADVLNRANAFEKEGYHPIFAWQKATKEAHR